MIKTVLLKDAVSRPSHRLLSSDSGVSLALQTSSCHTLFLSDFDAEGNWTHSHCDVPTFLWRSVSLPRLIPFFSPFLCQHFLQYNTAQLMLSRVWYHSVLQHYRQRGWSDPGKLEQQLSRPDQPPLLQLQTVNPCCSLKKVFLYRSEMDIVFQFWDHLF